MLHPPLPPTLLFYFLPLDFSHEVLAGEATRGLRIGGRRAVLLVGGQLHSLLVHSLGLHPLDQTEEVLVRHCRGVLACFRRGAALVVDPRGLRQRENPDQRCRGGRKFHGPKEFQGIVD